MADPNVPVTPDQDKHKKPQNIDEQTKKLINEVLRTQKRLENEKSGEKSGSQPGSPDVNMSDKESPHLALHPESTRTQEHPNRRGTLSAK